MLNDKRARGEWVPGDEEDVEAEDEVEEYDDPEEVEEDVVEEETDDAPRPTWELYAERERERQKHEHELIRAAKRGVAQEATRRARIV